jgi:hypothetical protein
MSEPEEGTPEYARRCRNLRQKNYRKNVKENRKEQHEEFKKKAALRTKISRSKKQAEMEFEHAMAIDKNAASYFAGPYKQFSDPTGVGVKLPGSVIQTMSLVKKLHSVSAATIPTSANANQSDTEQSDNSDSDTESESVTQVVNAPASEVSRVKKFNEMHAFLPEAEAYLSPTPCIMLFLLKQLAAFVKGKRKTIVDDEFFGVLEQDSSECSGIRSINGGRIEIFLNDKKRSHGCIESIIERMLRELSGQDDIEEGNKVVFEVGDYDKVRTRRCLVEYCDKLAMKDPRISKAEKPYCFQNHAIILSYGQAIAQDIHIDLNSSKLFQFGVVMTEDSEPTWEYKASVEPILKKGVCLRKIWDKFPKRLSDYLRANPEVNKIMNTFGCLFSEPKQVGINGGFVNLDSDEAVALGESFPVGTVFSMPGKVPHGGPLTNDFRAVLFFTGAPKGKTPYNSNEQYNRTMLLFDMFYLTWVDMTTGFRVLMLEKWYEEGLRRDRSALANIHHKPSKTLGAKLVKKETSDKKRKALIDDFARFDWTEEEWESGETERYEVETKKPKKSKALPTA